MTRNKCHHRRIYDVPHIVKLKIFARAAKNQPPSKMDPIAKKPRRRNPQRPRAPPEVRLYYPESIDMSVMMPLPNDVLKIIADHGTPNIEFKVLTLDPNMPILMYPKRELVDYTSDGKRVDVYQRYSKGLSLKLSLAGCGVMTIKFARECDAVHRSDLPYHFEISEGTFHYESDRRQREESDTYFQTIRRVNLNQRSRESSSWQFPSIQALADFLDDKLWVTYYHSKTGYPLYSATFPEETQYELAMERIPIRVTLREDYCSDRRRELGAGYAEEWKRIATPLTFVRSELNPIPWKDSKKINGRRIYPKLLRILTLFFGEDSQEAIRGKWTRIYMPFDKVGHLYPRSLRDEVNTTSPTVVAVDPAQMLDA